MYFASSERTSRQKKDEGARKVLKSTLNFFRAQIVAKKEAFTKALQSNTVPDEKVFRKHQRIVKKTVEKAKEDWICRVARVAETAVKDGHAMWRKH